VRERRIEPQRAPRAPREIPIRKAGKDYYIQRSLLMKVITFQGSVGCYSMLILFYDPYMIIGAVEKIISRC
jgi:hypothetical protein